MPQNGFRANKQNGGIITVLSLSGPPINAMGLLRLTSASLKLQPPSFLNPKGELPRIGQVLYVWVNVA